MIRAPILEPEPPAIWLSAEIPVMAWVTTEVVIPGMASFEGEGILQAHGQPEHHDEAVLDATRGGPVNRGGDDRRGPEQHRLDQAAHREQVTTVHSEECEEATTQECAKEEHAQRDQGRWDREPVGSGQPEGDEEDIPRHIGHEDAPQEEKAEGVDHSGDHRQSDQHRAERAVLVARWWDDGLPDLHDGGIHRGCSLSMRRMMATDHSPKGTASATRWSVSHSSRMGG